MENKANAEVEQAMVSTTSTTTNLNGNQPPQPQHPSNVQPQPSSDAQPQPSSDAHLRSSKLPRSAEIDLMNCGRRLCEMLRRFSAVDYLTQLLAMDYEYKDLLHAIDAGGHLEREADEDPAEVLADLRANYTPTPRQLAERAYILRCMGDLLREVEGLVNGIQNELHSR